MSATDDEARDNPQPRTGNLGSYQRERFEEPDASMVVYRKGSGPAVLVITEIPGISPEVLGFADMVAESGCTAILPDLFGVAGKDFRKLSRPRRLAYGLSTVLEVCISREFSVFASGRSSPIVERLRRLAAKEHARCGGPGVGVVGMCFTGGFALAMAVDPRVLAPVLSQPSSPANFSRAHRYGIDSDAQTVEVVRGRCAKEGLEVYGLRFKGDPHVPEDRFRYLRDKLGSGFVAIELAQGEGNPKGPLPRRHSVLTNDLIERPGEPTYEARERVLRMFQQKLSVPVTH
jgi:dienelactone hydrolase